MNTEREQQKNVITRRQLLRGGGVLACSTILVRLFPNALFARPGALSARAAAGYAPQGNQLEAMRAQMGATPIQSTKLADNLTLLMGPGGNVLVLHGPDGKMVVDSFVQPAWTKLKQALDGMGNAPIRRQRSTWPGLKPGPTTAAFQGGSRFNGCGWAPCCACSAARRRAW